MLRACVRAGVLSRGFWVDALGWTEGFRGQKQLHCTMLLMLSTSTTDPRSQRKTGGRAQEGGVTDVVVHGGRGQSGLVCFGCGATIERGRSWTGHDTVRARCSSLISNRQQVQRARATGERPLPSLPARRTAELCERCRLLQRGDLLAALKATEEIDPVVFVKQLRPLRHQYIVAVLVVDALHFDATYVKFVRDFIGANPLILAVTKMDLICDPENHIQWERLRAYFRTRAATSNVRVVDAVPVSGLTWSGIPELKRVLEAQGQFNVFVMGVANVGKSTLVNALKDSYLSSTWFRDHDDRLRKQMLQSLPCTTSPLPGTTLRSTRIPCFSNKDIALFDTPGILENHFRFPSAKERLGPPQRPTPVEIKLRWGTTVVIGDDLVHINISKVPGREYAEKGNIQAAWYSTAEPKIQVIGHVASRERRAQLRREVGRNSPRGARRTSHSSNVYGDGAEEVDDDEFDSVELATWDNDLPLRAPETAAGQQTEAQGKPWDHLPACASNKGKEEKFWLPKNASFELPMCETDGAIIYSTDVVLFHLGFLAVRSTAPATVGVFGPEQLAVRFRPCLPIITGEDRVPSKEEMQKEVERLADRTADFDDDDGGYLDQDDEVFDRLDDYARRDRERRDYFYKHPVTGSRRGRPL